MDLSPGFRAREVTLRFPRRPKSVTLKGRPWSDITGQEVRLPKADRARIRAEY
ncbi:MAG: hypothetical protein ACKV22_16715 [Bryobacteraceae bacterium]